MKKRFSTMALITSSLLSVALTMAAILGIFIIRFGGQEGIVSALKYADVVKIIGEHYIGDTDLEAVEEAGYDAMISSLGDRWSYYMTSREYEYYSQYSENRYAGIGVSITADEESGGLLITDITPDSPAAKAGIAVGDVMLAVDGESIIGMTVMDVKAIIQPKLGGELVLTLLDADGNQIDKTVNCELIYSEPVTYEMLEGDVGYIRIANFESGSGDGAVSAVDVLIADGAKSLVFDVRGNPGGKVTQLLKILDYLLPEGDLFVTRGKDGSETVEVSDPSSIDLPMAVLVDANSYSAAEFFAAALMEYERATIVGEQTTGKGRSQVTFRLSDGSAVHISNNVYLTPNRIDLSEVGGITPDIEIEQGSERDFQLEAAVESLS